MLHIYETVELLLPAMAEFVIDQSVKAIETNGKFTIALSGGSSPQKLYALLASEKYKDRIEWNKVFFFFGDERHVPAEDIQSNFRMVKETLFDPLGISAANIFAVNTTLSPAESAQAYEQVVRQNLNGKVAFDLILLGLGDDAHTASLFPHTTVIKEKQALVKEIFIPKVNQSRITFTEPLINSAKVISFFVYGRAKAKAVNHILHDPYDPDTYPAQLVKPLDGKVYWFMDKAAAQGI